MATEILLAIEEELEITGIKGDFEIIFGKIQQSDLLMFFVHILTILKLIIKLLIIFVQDGFTSRG